jgi:hypothetical protein
MSWALHLEVKIGLIPAHPASPASQHLTQPPGARAEKAYGRTLSTLRCEDPKAHEAIAVFIGLGDPQRVTRRRHGRGQFPQDFNAIDWDGVVEPDDGVERETVSTGGSKDNPEAREPPLLLQ